MIAAFLTTLLFAISAMCGHRTATKIGGVEANFWRIALATIFLTIWANTCGTGFAGAPGWFMLSGLFGIGLGDSAYFQALPRLGSRRTVLLTQCLTAPFAALIEWLWLGSKLNLPEILCIAAILAGVAIALAPGDHRHIEPRQLKIGVLACVCSAVAEPLARSSSARPLPSPTPSGFIRTLARPAISACSAAFCFRPSLCWFSNGAPRTRTADCFRKNPGRVP